MVCLVGEEREIAGAIGEHGAENAERDGEKDVMGVVVLPPVSVTLRSGDGVRFECSREAHR